MESSSHPSPGLYHRILGDAFDEMPPALRRFHDAPFGAVARGTLCVVWGRGRLRRGLARLMRLPSPGEHVPVSLQVQVENHGERWIRHFGSQCLMTRQYQRQGLLIETAGPLRLGFRLTADTTGMQFRFARCWLLGLLLPNALAPRVHAEARGGDACWRVKVQIEVPLLGLLTRYEGELVPLTGP